MRIIQIPLFIALFALCGCDKGGQSSEAKEERNPLVKQGQAYMEIKDWNQAEKAFKEAIENNPRMARPHLDLATIYHQHKPDYISSIFYYKRYLELRPDSEKAEFIQEQIEKVQIALAKAILTQSGAYQAIQERDQLRQENAELKRQLTAQPKAATPPKTATQTSPEKSVTQTIPKSANSAQATHQIYTVVSGDNLTKIANTFYGDGDYDAIYQANRDRMKNPGDLRIGQTLVIPNK
jgi:tetratricopeptide (TPR) repeat protein